MKICLITISAFYSVFKPYRKVSVIICFVRLLFFVVPVKAWWFI